MNIEKNSEVFDSRQRLMVGIVLAAFTMVNVVYWFINCNSRAFLLAFSLLTVLLCAISIRWYIVKAQGQINRLFVVSLLLLGSLFTFAFSPGSVPDEPFHYWSTYSVSDLMMGKEVDFEEKTLVARQSDVDLGLNETYILSKSSLVDSIRSAELFSTNSNEVVHSVDKNALDYSSSPIYIRFFAALGLTLGRILNLGAYPTFILGRLFNFMMFCCLAYLAVRTTPVAKTGFMAVSLLPMTLHLAASYSYDGGTIGLAMVLFSYLLKGIYRNEPFSSKEMALSIVSAILLAPCKAVYSVVAFTVILIPTTRFSSKRAAMVFKVMLPVICILTVILVRVPTLSEMVNAPTGSQLDYRGAETGVFYSPKNIIEDPLGTFYMFARTLVVNEDSYLTGVIGGQLGWLQANTTAPFFVVIPFLITLLAAFQMKDGDELEVPVAHRIWFFLLACAGWIGVMMSMYFGWTFTSEVLIQGIQGRYLLPLVPLICISLRTRVVQFSLSTNNVIPLAMLFLNCWYLMRLVATILVI